MAKIKSNKRHLGVTLESIDSKIDLVLEMTVQNTEDIAVMKDDIDNIKGDVDIIKGDVDIIKSDVDNIKSDVVVIKDDINIMKDDISNIKNDLKQKVGRDEFVLLEKRVSQLEKAIHR